jgi:hypothetical protein
MEVNHGRILPGPQEKYRTTDDMLDWMSRQFRIFGDSYKASVYGATVYVPDSSSLLTIFSLRTAKTT